MSIASYPGPWWAGHHHQEPGFKATPPITSVAVSSWWVKEIHCFQPLRWQVFSSSPSIYTQCSSCNEARDCYWCQQEQKCVHHTECCSFEDSNACCGASPQRERFSYSPECLSAKCLRGMLVYVCIEQVPTKYSLVESHQTSIRHACSSMHSRIDD